MFYGANIPNTAQPVVRTENTIAQPDVNVSQFGLGGFLDGISNLALLYGASKIRSEFPEQYSSPQDPIYRPDDAVYEARLAGMSSQNNMTNYLLIGGLVLGGLAALVFVAKS